MESSRSSTFGTETCSVGQIFVSLKWHHEK